DITWSLLVSTLTACGDSISTGNRVQAGMDHSAVGATPTASVPTTGSSSAPQNAAPTSLISRSDGQIIWEIVARDGRMSTNSRRPGTDPYPIMSAKYKKTSPRPLLTECSACLAIAYCTEMKSCW